MEELDRKMTVANAYYDTNHFASCESLLEEILTLDPGHQGAKNLLAHVYMNTDRETEAIELARTLVGTSSTQAAYYVIGRSYNNRFQFPEATEYLSKALEIDPHSPLPMAELIKAYHYLGQREMCYKTIDRALSLAPEDPHVLYNVYYVFHVAEQTTILEREILATMDRIAFGLLAYCRARTEHKDGALEKANHFYRMAVMQSPDNANVRNEMRWFERTYPQYAGQ